MSLNALACLLGVIAGGAVSILSIYFTAKSMEKIDQLIKGKTWK